MKLDIKVFFIFLISLVSPVLTTSATDTPIADSLLTEKHIYAYTFSDPEKAKQIIKLMRERDLETAFSLDIAEGDLYYNNGKHRNALIFYTRALNSKSEQNTPLEYMQQLHRMLSCYDGLHDEVKKAECVKLLLDKAGETGNKEMKSIALFNMGTMIYYQEEKQQGYKLIKEAIEVMKQSDYKNKYHNLRYNYNTLLMMLQRDGRYEEALETLDDLESVVTESTHRTYNIEGLDDKEKKTLFAWRAVILSYLDRAKEADKAYQQWEITGTDYRKDDYLITTYLIHRKRFDKVIEIYSPRERFFKENNDTINYHMRSLKRMLGQAYEGKGEYEKAAGYYKALAVLTDSLKIREQKSAAVELATVYETNEKEIKLQEQATHAKIRNILLSTAAVAICFLIVLLWRKIKYARTIRYKNKRMVTVIEELLQQKDELLAVKNELSTLKNSPINEAFSENTPVTVMPCNEITNTVHDSNSSEDRTLFETLDSIVMREKLYLTPNLSREDLMQLIQVNKNRFGHIIQQYTGTNTVTYINNKRLEYATRLLKIHPDQTISTVAQQCGIPNIPTFNRLFKAKFGMTPVEFKYSIQSAGNKTGNNDDGQSDIYT